MTDRERLAEVEADRKRLADAMRLAEIEARQASWIDATFGADADLHRIGKFFALMELLRDELRASSGHDWSFLPAPQLTERLDAIFGLLAG